MFLLLVTVAYLVLAHIGTVSGQVELRVLAVVLLMVLVLACLRGMLTAQVLVLAVVGACLYFAHDPMMLLLYAPSVLFPLALAAIFGRSLLPGRQPVIERIVWHMYDRPAQLSAEHLRYARGVTIYWCLVCLALALLNLVLALFASPALWSWVGNVATYVVTGLAMLAEYAWRHRVFHEHPYRNLFDFLRRMTLMAPLLAREFGQDWRREDADVQPPAVRP